MVYALISGIRGWRSRVLSVAAVAFCPLQHVFTEIKTRIIRREQIEPIHKQRNSSNRHIQFIRISYRLERLFWPCWPGNCCWPERRRQSHRESISILAHSARPLLRFDHCNCHRCAHRVCDRQNSSWCDGIVAIYSSTVWLLWIIFLDKSPRDRITQCECLIELPIWSPTNSKWDSCGFWMRFPISRYLLNACPNRSVDLIDWIDSSWLSC